MQQDSQTREGGAGGNAAAGFRIGEWLVLPAEGVLRSRVEERHLAPRPMAILELLGDRRGAVVGKEEIFAAVWRGAAVEDGALPRCISQIRSALGDSAREPRYIRTIPKKGYRLIAPVEEPAEPARTATAPAPATRAATPPRRALRWLAAASLAAALALLAIGVRDRIEAPSPAHGVQRTIAVLGIDELTDGPETGWLAAALAEMLTTELAVSDQLRTVPEDTVALMKGQLSVTGVPEGETLDSLRCNLGVDLWVVGTYLLTPEGDRPRADPSGDAASRPIRLDLQVLAGEPPEILAAVVVTGTVEELGDLVLLAGLRLREALGLGARLANETRLAGQAGPRDPGAARLYYQGLHALRRLEARAAVDLLARARASDAANPYVQSALARAWSALGYDALAAAAAGAALETSSGLPREQRLWIEARAHAIHGEWPQAIERLRALWLVTADNLEYAHELARVQLDAGRPRDALATLEDLTRRSGGVPDDPRMPLAIGEAALQLGELPRSLAAASRSLSLARKLGATLVAARALDLRARSLHALGRIEEAEAALEEAAGIFTEAGDRASQARARVTLALWLERRGEAGRAEALARSALESFVSIGDRSGEALALRRLATHVWRRRGAGEAEVMFERALAICRDIGDRAGEAATLDALAVATAIHGGTAPIVPLFEQTLALYREIGDRQRVSATLANLGRVALLDGDLGPAIEYLGQAEAALRQLGAPRELAVTLFNLGHARSTGGELARADASFREAIGIFRETHNRGMLAESLEGLAEIRLQAGDPEAARPLLEEGLDLQMALEDEGMIAVSQTALARLWMVLGDLRRAEDLARGAEAIADASRDINSRQAARARLAEVLLAAGRPAAARAKALELEEHLLRKPPPDLTMAVRRVTIARVIGRTGDRGQALEMLDQVAGFAAEKGARLLRLEAELGRLELREGSAGDQQRLSALQALAARAVDLGSLWIARRARELIEEKG